MIKIPMLNWAIIVSKNERALNQYADIIIELAYV